MAQAFYRRGFRRGALVFLHWFLPQHLFLGLCGNFVHRAFWGQSARGLRLRICARHLFCSDVRLMDRGNALRARRPFSRRRMGRLTADWFGLVRSERRRHLGDQPAFAAKHHARLLRRAFPLGFARGVSRVLA